MNIKFSPTIGADIKSELDKHLNDYFNLRPRLTNMESTLEEDDPIENHVLVLGKQKELQQIRAEIESILHENDLKLTHHQSTYDEWIEVKEL